MRSLVVIILFLGVLAGCFNRVNDEFEGGILSSASFVTPAQQGAALGAAFTELYNFATHNSLWSMQEVSTDEMIITQKGSDWFDGGQWIRVHQHDFQPIEESIDNAWVSLFAGINNVNRLLAQFADNISPETEAELRAVRAYYYWRLLDNYGNVPIVLSFDVPEGFQASNNSDFQTGRQEVFNLVESELLESLPNLTSTTGIATLGRMNEFVARFILAKLYLQAEIYTGIPRYNDAETQLDLIINSGNFSLNPNFLDGFAIDGEATPESILEIPYDVVFLQGFNFAVMTMLGPAQQAFQLTEQPWNGYSSLQSFYESYEQTDARIDGFIEGPIFNPDGSPAVDEARNQTIDPEAQINFVPFVNELEPNGGRDFGVRIGKWSIFGQNENLSNNFILFRYSDVLLMKAEVMLRQGNAGGGQIYMDMVRERAGVTPITLTEENLLAERGREFFAEGWRRQDLIRFGQFTSGTWEFKEPSESFRDVYPIPQNQINVNPSLNQNPGY